MNKRHLLLIIFMIMWIAGCNPTGPENGGTPALQQLSSQKIARDMTSAVIHPDGTVWTWGIGMFGTLGNGSLETTETPVQAIGINDAAAIDLFLGAAVAADKKGNIYFWGDYSIYSEPPGFDTVVTIPTIVSNLSGVNSLVFGTHEIFYFLRNDGSVWYAQFDHYNPTKLLEPVRIEGLNDAVQVTECYALKSDGTLFNFIATIPDLVSPPPNRGGPIPDLNNIAQVENVWFRRSVILKKDGTVWAWGWNDFGQLGNGTLQDSEVPVRVGNLTDIVAISAHYDYNLALKRDGTVWFWGLEKPYEKIGKSTPIQIQNLKKVSAIYADYNSLILCEDGSYWTFNVDDKIPGQIIF